MSAAGMSANAVGIVVFWYCVTLVFNWTAFNLVVLKDDPALALLPADITLIEMFACTICGALTLYNKGLAFIPPPELRIRMLVRRRPLSGYSLQASPRGIFPVLHDS